MAARDRTQHQVNILKMAQADCRRLERVIAEMLDEGWELAGPVIPVPNSLRDPIDYVATLVKKPGARDAQ